MKISLLFPPPSPAANPYGSLPALASWLRQHGHQVVPRDLNVEIWDWLLSQDGLTTVYQKSAHKLSRGVDHLCPHPMLSYKWQSLSPVENGEQIALCLEDGEQLIGSIEDARALVRGTGFYDPDEYGRKIDLIDRAETLYRAAYYLTSTRAVRTISSWSDPLVRFSSDEEVNPLISLFTDLSLSSILDDDPGLVGISVPFGDQLMPAITMADMLKKKRPDLKVALGGPIITLFQESLAQEDSLFDIVDFFITSDGEIPLLGLVEALENGEEPSKVPDLIYRRGMNIHANPPGVKIDMNRLPTPDPEGLPLSQYLSPDVVFTLASSRRCYWNGCAFCVMEPPRPDSCSRQNTRDADHLIEDVEALQKRYGARCFFFSDPAVAPKVLSQFSKQLIEKEIEISWYGFARFEKTFDEDFCRRLADAGCRRLMFGLESGNPRVNDLLNKGIDLNQAIQTVSHCRDLGISVNVTCIVGFPTETAEEARDTASFFIDNHESFGQFTTFSLSPFSLLRGSSVYYEPEKYGVEIINEDKRYSSYLKYRVQRGLNQDEARALRQDLFLRVQEKLQDKSFFGGIDFDTHTFFYADHYKEWAVSRASDSAGAQQVRE